MKQVLMVFFGLFAVSVFASEIEVGKHYTAQEINSFEDLSVYARVEIVNRSLVIYKLASSGRFDIEKIFVLLDNQGRMLEAVGLNYSDNTGYHYSTEITSEYCIIKIGFDEIPVSRLLYMNSDCIEFKYFPVDVKYIADICLSVDKIYYSTEHGDTITRIDIISGETFIYKGRYPNVNLYSIKQDSQTVVVFAYENKQYIIQGNQIIPATKQYQITENKKRLSDFLVGN